MKNIFLTIGVVLAYGVLILMMVKTWHLIDDAQGLLQQCAMWWVVCMTSTTFLTIGVRGATEQVSQLSPLNLPRHFKARFLWLTGR